MRKKLIATMVAISLPCFVMAEGQMGEDILSRNDLWVLIAAALVFFMQAGFKVFETGLVKKQHRAGIGAKNLMDWVAGSVAFYILGFGFMFGSSTNGWVGSGLMMGDGLEINDSFVFFLFQLAFAGTALTIVSGAMSGRTALIPYFVASLVTATVIYPLFGHWAWGNLLHADNMPWLASLGFMDFAGSTVVHSVGAWIALVGVWVVGPRVGRYDKNGKIQRIKASDYSYSILGVMILWLGWWGFNGGSTLAFNTQVPKIILNTNLSAAAAAISAMFHAIVFQKKSNVLEKIMGGTLTGLVAITACCNVVSSQSSLIIGVLAGIIHNIMFVVISEKWKLDDPVGAIAVHGFGGVFGTLCVALFGQQELLELPRWEQLAVQCVGIVTCFVFTTLVALLMFYILRRTIGLRVSPKQESTGAFFDSEEEDGEEDQDSTTGSNIVHHVSAKVSNRGYNVYTVKEYVELSMDFRSSWEAADRIQYLNEEGYVIPVESAQKQLNEMVAVMGSHTTSTLKRVRIR
ncbi:ammonium transporter [Reichenbachiella agarivorans]|uniref:Ammonium transporter n=1 Tax=Reichenbachiella agarivorans TaxID=2979464 RepID=A0ABY6CM19_9BACT|nr:ammonium transporter [Reichenbachiella agarivorans]UXP31512.1 ammonium transporter [Reichenbachiella agarivorans]